MNTHTFAPIRQGHAIVPRGTTLIESIQSQRYDGKRSKACSLAPYYLPLRIDIDCPEPPLIGLVKRNSLSLAEVHVPAGCAEAYAANHQWCKSAVITDDAGVTIDNFAESYANYCERWCMAEKLTKRRDFSQASHVMMAKACLHGWDVEAPVETDYGIIESANALYVRLKAPGLVYTFAVPISAPLTIWAEIAAQLPTPED